MNPLDLHKSLLKLRRGEELLARLFKDQEMRTHTHFGVGQEAISVGVIAALNLPSDVVYTHHRSHLAYLACGGDFYKLACELYGREDGCSKGRGGSVHLTARSTGFISSSPIVGQNAAVAVGSALAFKMDKQDRVAVCFFGDGTFEEGGLYEAMNFAAIHSLPIIFVCENNLYSTESPLSTRQPIGTSLCERAASFKWLAQNIDGNNVEAVYNWAHHARFAAASGQPCLIEAMTYRWLEHVGPFYDWEQKRTYRSKEELEDWKLKDPIKRSYEWMRDLGHSADELAAIDHDIQAELVEQALRAREAPFPAKTELLQNVW